MDSVLAVLMGFDGSNATQVFFGLLSCCINVYHMPSNKGGRVFKAYQDFMRYEGVPQCLHQDLAPEKKIDEIIQKNIDMRVKDTWSEATHPNQNPVEQGGVRILKAGVDGILDQTGEPAESWLYAYSYIADINNHYASQFLGWRTPIEIRHGYTPDISPFLLYSFWEQIYFKTDEYTPNSKERKGNWLGVSLHIGDKLTYFIY